MTKKRVSLIAICVIILLSLFLLYWFYFQEPQAFPADEQLVDQINEIFPKADAETIQENIQLDQEHVFVPFLSSENNYGASYWVWERNKWKPSYIDTTGEPTVWKIDKEDPSSFHLVWNLHPDDQISYADFYLIRDRGYHISNGEHTYVPRIQLEDSVALEEESYGVLQLPEDWRSFMTQTNKLALAQNPHVNFTSLLPDVHAYIGWTPFNEDNEITYPDNSVNGHGYINGDINTDFVRIIEEAELEK
ncbi:hypothetical protein SAMN05216232_0131 [Virgibacillus subterraneus]|uniref:Uncharacterized protein n=1 Tax=Virgibacillus subterraneus TaxID=621109 RepID=A0A1H9L4F6_9BACI|nr:hypothetical protein [Virgibacillus subterraneus]SER06218.1 hypothetical protein SAMN05216232_0131 [Virgibacillus subterraneus]